MRCVAESGVRRLAALGCFVIAITAFGGGARAEGFFERLFGAFMSPRSQRTRPQTQPQYAPRPMYPPFSAAPAHPRGTLPAETLPRGSTGRYRTVCVRLCDGYYFPISNGISPRRFIRDANICRSRCGAETRLFSMPASAPQIKTARDQSGMSYAKLANAFLYRKRRVASCSCRPEPWSHEARARHASYAEERRRQIAQRDQQAREERAVANGVAADVAKELFGQHVAEVLPPAPDKDWQNADPAPLRVALTTLSAAPVIESPPSGWTAKAQPAQPFFDARKPLPEPQAPAVQPTVRVHRARNWLSRMRGTDPRMSPLPDGP